MRRARSPGRVAPVSLAGVSVVAGLAAVLAVSMDAPAAAQGRDTGEGPAAQVVLSGDAIIVRGRVAGEVVVFHGSATIAGVVRGDVVVLDGPIVVSGQVSGDVVALDGAITLEATAQVAGSVRSGEAVTVAEGAQVAGSIQQGVRVTLSGPLDVLGALLASVAIAVSLLLVVLLAVLIAPRGVDAVGRVATSAPLAAGAWGLAMAVGLPVVVLVAAVTVVGIPLAIAVTLGLGFLWLTGLAVSVLAVGRAMVRPPRSRLVAALAGWAVGGTLGLVPGVNVAWWVLGSVFGLGVMLVAVWRARRGPDGAAALDVPIVPHGRHRPGRRSPSA